MTSFITDLIWGPQYTGLSAYLPEPFAALASITLCYDIGSIILIGIVLTVSSDVVRDVVQGVVRESQLLTIFLVNSLDKKW